MRVNRDKFRVCILLVLIGAFVAIVAACAFVIGRWSMMEKYPMLRQEEFANFNMAYQEILDAYLDGAEAGELLHGAVQGMVGALDDPYSSYYAGMEGAAYLERYSDHVIGVGIELRQEDGEFVINGTIKDSPADLAGLLQDDVVVQIDGVDVYGMKLEELLGMTHGQEGTAVTISLRREGLAGLFEAKIVRAPVPVETVSSEMVSEHIGLIDISRFSGSTVEEFDKAVVQLKAQGMKALLLDLRQNPGGLLNAAIEIADKIVPSNKVIVQVVYKDEAQVRTYRSKQQEAWEFPVVVLTNGSTASSSEVLTAALQSSAGAIIVGERTFGKGVVQAYKQFEDQSVLKLTEAQWRTPDGQWIQGQGVDPTFEVAMPDYAYLPTLPSNVKMREGDFGQEVKTMEIILRSLGYAAGEPEGIFDRQTAYAVSEFQRREGLDSDGVVAGRTANRMMQRLRGKIQQEDPQRERGIELLAEALQK